MSEIDWDDLEEQNEYEALLEAENAKALTPEGIAEANALALAQYDRYRRAADAVTDAWRDRPDVLRVTLIGSLAIMPWKEIPRHSPYRQERIQLWHECSDVDLAVWLSCTGDLRACSHHVNSQPTALKKFRHSCGLNIWQTSPIAFQTSSKVLAPALLR